MIPWEENLRYQNGNGLFLLFLILLGLLIGVVFGFWTGDWQLFETVVLFAGGLLAIVVVWGVCWWCIGHAVSSCARLLRRVFHRR